MKLEAMLWLGLKTLLTREGAGFKTGTGEKTGVGHGIKGEERRGSIGMRWGCSEDEEKLEREGYGWRRGRLEE